MRRETYAVFFKDGTKKYLYCKKNEIEEEITIAEYRKLDHIQQLNRGADPVKHRPFTITI